MTATWVCTKCGRTFTRKSSGLRHLINVENGTSSLVTRAQYEMGIRTGVLVPSFTRPIFAKNQDVDVVTMFRKALKEKFVGYLAEKAVQDPDSRRFVAAMLMNEPDREKAGHDDSDELLKLISKMSS